MFMCHLMHTNAIHRLIRQSRISINVAHVEASMSHQKSFAFRVAILFNGLAKDSLQGTMVLRPRKGFSLSFSTNSRTLDAAAQPVQNEMKS